MTGRFATVDPIRDGMNWYVYTGNDPVNHIDPWGLATEDGGIPVINSRYKNRNNEAISSLHPNIQQSAKDFISEANRQGIDLLVTSDYRSVDQQNKLYNKGRDKNGNVTDRSAVVTNVPGGQSNHNFGLALDVVEVKDGAALWENDNWDKIGNIGKSEGFEWGGDWTSFEDKPHFENTQGLSTSQLKALYDEGKLDDAGYVLIEKE